MPSTRPGEPPVVSLPKALEIALKPKAEHTPLDAFMAKYEPYFTENSEPWRKALLGACIYYADASQAERMRIRSEERREELAAGFDSKNGDPLEPHHG